jgi:hypothetical protein
MVNGIEFNGMKSAGSSGDGRMSAATAFPDVQPYNLAARKPRFVHPVSKLQPSGQWRQL